MGEKHGERKISLANTWRRVYIFARAIFPRNKKKALKATWDSENEFEKEVDTANMCFMVNDTPPKVTSEELSLSLFQRVIYYFTM